MNGINEALYQEILENIGDGIYYVDRHRRITFWNKGAEMITGFSRQEVLGRRCSDNILKHVDDQGVCLCLSSCPLAQTIQDGKSRTAAVHLHHKDGHRLPVLVRVSPIWNRDREIVGAVEVFSDNSAGVAALARLKELADLAFHDALTGLANRNYLETFLAARFNELHRFGWPFGAFLADIDHFKQVNDRYGHQMGDLVLKMVANTLAKYCRSFDLVGRWGGEEFVGVVSHIKNRDDLRLAADRLRRLVANSWICPDRTPISVTVSLGATLARPDDTFQSLLTRADHLLYRSKAAGRNCVSLD